MLPSSFVGFVKGSIGFSHSPPAELSPPPSPPRKVTPSPAWGMSWLTDKFNQLRHPIQFYDQNTLQPEFAKSQAILLALTGSEELNLFIHSFAENVLYPRLKDYSSLVSIKLIEANLSRSLVNLAAKVKKDNEQIESGELIAKILALASDKEHEQGEELLKEVREIDQRDTVSIIDLQDKVEAYNRTTQALLDVAFPQGHCDLLLPDLPIVQPVRRYVFSQLKETLASFLWDFQALKTNALSQNERFVKSRPGGEEFAAALEKVVKGAQFATTLEKAVKGVVDQKLPDLIENFSLPEIKREDPTVVKALLRQLSPVGYPLALHVVANLIRSADPAKPVPMALVESLVGKTPDEILEKAGLDAKGLATILPFKSEEAATFLRGYVLALAKDFQVEVVNKPKMAPDPRLRGYEEGRSSIREGLKKCLEKKELAAWMNQNLGFSVDLSELPFKDFAIEYGVDAASELLSNLALSHPQNDTNAVDMMDRGLDHLTKIALQHLNRTEVIALRNMPEGSEKEMQKKRLFGPLVLNLCDRFEIRCPKIVQGFVKSKVRFELLPNLIYRALDQWMATGEANMAKVKAQAADGAAVVEAIKAISERTELGPLSFFGMLHILDHLSTGADGKEALGTVVINALCQSIFTVRDRENLKPLVDDLMKRAGLDVQSLEKKFPFGAEFVAKQCEEQLFAFWIDFHAKVMARQGIPSEIAKEIEGDSEGRRLLEVVVKDLMPTIREVLADDENRKDIQETIGEVIAEHFKREFANTTLPIGQDWLSVPFKELMESSPHLPAFQEFFEPYLVDSIGDLFAHLAHSYPSERKNNFVTDGVAALLKIIENEVKDPQLVQKLQDWMAMPEGTDWMAMPEGTLEEKLKKAQAEERTLKEKREKDRAKERLRAELFGPCAAKVLEKGGWDNPSNIRAPEILRPFLKKLLAETVFPDQLFRLTCNMIVPKKLSSFQQERLENMGDAKELECVAEGVAEALFPRIFTQTPEKCREIARAICEDETLSASHLQQLFTPGNENFQPVWQFGEKWVATAIKTGLSNLALNYKGIDQGSIASNIGSYLRDLLNSIKIDSSNIDLIRFYQKKRAALVDAKEPERTNIEKECQKAYDDLLAFFKTHLVELLMQDMGFLQPADLPVPYFLQKMLWERLQNQILPDLCLTVAQKVVGAVSELIPDSKELGELEDAFKKRYEKSAPPGASLSAGEKAPFVRAIEERLTDYLVKEIESQVALHGAEGALKALDSVIIPSFQKRAPQEVLEKHRKEIAEWVGEESPQLVNIVKDQLGKSLKQNITVPILKASLHFLEHLEKVEAKHPEQLFEFAFDVIPLVSDHFKFALKVAEKEGKSHIHEVDPVKMTQEFERGKRLHPAMASSQQVQACIEFERCLKQLEQQVKIYRDSGYRQNWEAKINWPKQIASDVKALPPEECLKKVQELYQKLQDEIDEKMERNFFNDFSEMLLKMAGFTGASSLPGGKEFWNLIGLDQEKGWEKFNGIVPWLLMEGMRSAFAPEQLNSYIAGLLKALNNNLEERRTRGEMAAPATPQKLHPKVKEMQERCTEMFEQLKKILPKSLITEMTEIPLIGQIPGKVLAEALRDAMKLNPVSKLIEQGLISAVKELPKDFPMTSDGVTLLKEKRTQQNKVNIERISKEGKDVLPLMVAKIEQNLFAMWVHFQEMLDKWIFATLGAGGKKAKDFLDKIFYKVFISIWMGPTYSAMRWLLFFILKSYSKIMGSDNVEHGRSSIVETPINANLLFKVGDRFKAFYGQV